MSLYFYSFVGSVFQDRKLGYTKECESPYHRVSLEFQVSTSLTSSSFVEIGCNHSVVRITIQSLSLNCAKKSEYCDKILLGFLVAL